MKTLCYWCLESIEKESPEVIEFPKGRNIFFCSKDCVGHATTVIRGKKDIDIPKIKKHINQIKQKQKRERKVACFSHILEKEKLSANDLAVLSALLNQKQKNALIAVGISNLSWAVHGEPKKLMAKIDGLVKAMRG